MILLLTAFYEQKCCQYVKYMYTHNKGHICFTELLLKKNESSSSPYKVFEH